MFAIANCLLILIAATNLTGLLMGKTPTLRQLTRELIESGGGAERLTGALVMAGLAQVYLCVLTLPLKAVNYHLGLSWAILMLVAALEAVYTTRLMLSTVKAQDKESPFPLHDSRWYQGYQVVYNVGTIGVCALLLLPR